MTDFLFLATLYLLLSWFIAGLFGSDEDEAASPGANLIVLLFGFIPVCIFEAGCWLRRRLA